ncbi:hypothetical protein B9J77_02305 [candidate division NPL-UPA2 bacterium Unc8]|uniref:Haloacid dehalogenase-like hydrolase n=1 Tax=candidate division NPL-UPA2 bacterium Unc8 TaxID=1980939 RepID=A0A399FX04_UNCN2|nr:hypothetical protein [Bacillota bacterium]MBT9146567.1 hypothetical protein [Bacillota bacterium]RII00577.1 MAG: hypothetical protein B9J77_02305 [candidate division NPL-UPA2 bacterium Unc8]
MKEIASHIYSVYSKEETDKHLRKVDLVLIDMDGCVYPRTTGLSLFKNCCLLYFDDRNIKIIFYIISFIAYYPIIMFLHLIRLVNNHKLMCFFSGRFRGIPLSYLQAAARPIPAKSFPGAKKVLSILSKHAKTGFISFGLDMVLNEYKVQFRDEGRQLISFYDSNHCIWRKDSERIVSNGIEQEQLMIKASDKADRARERIKEFRAKAPLVIGHSQGDLEMMKVAKEYGGLALGFNPSSKIAKHCHIVVKAKNWQPLASYLSSVFSDTMDKKCI